MSRVKILWLGFIIGALLGGIFYLVSYFVDESIEMYKNVETAILYLVSVPAFISFKLKFAEILMPISIIIYCGLIGWLFCAAWTIPSKFRYIVLIVLVVLLGVVHRYCMVLVKWELEQILTIFEGLLKGTYKIVK